MKNWAFQDVDQPIAEEFYGFLPERVFDSHAHLYRIEDLNLSPPHPLFDGPSQATSETWREHTQLLVGKSSVQGALFMGYPTRQGNLRVVNEYLISQLASEPDSRGLILLSPDSLPETLEECLSHPRVIGVKPYHVYSNEVPSMEALLSSYLPEWAWEIADRQELVILLHLVRERALADPGNHREIRARCEKYPHAKLVLAHAARGFHARNTIQGLAALKGLDNVWFDMAAVCEPTVLRAILDEFGPRRLMWGSDFPVSAMKGRCVTVGDGFVWLDNNTVSWESLTPVCHPTLVGLESLRALKEASADFGLDREDLRDIFCDNAMRLFGMKEEATTSTQHLYEYAKSRIPGGTQLLSKRPEMMAPNQWPAYFREARGCEVWDLDGKHYYDFSTNGIGSCLLGFRDPDVTRAVRRRINLGSMSSLNPPEEVELADLLCEIHPWAEQARFARCGGEIAQVAVRIARATTDRSLVAICGYHGWHDWYMAANLGESDALRGHLLPGLDPLGVPRELRGTTVPFRYNHPEEFQEIMDHWGDQLAAVIMEPCRNQDPEHNFLEFVRERAHQCGALLIFDEITIGWRLHFGGAHLRFGVAPDMAIYAKSLSNGHPMAAVIGTREAMTGAHSSFISSTYWTESVGPVAALAALRKMQRIDVPAHAERIGLLVIDCWRRLGKKHGLPVVAGEGYPCLAHLRFDHEEADTLRTLFTQFMLARDFLAGAGVYITLAHTEEIVSLYETAVDEVFGEMAEALASGRLREQLKGPVAHSGFRRLV